MATLRPSCARPFQRLRKTSHLPCAAEPTGPPAHWQREMRRTCGSVAWGRTARGRPFFRRSRHQATRPLAFGLAGERGQIGPGPTPHPRSMSQLVRGVRIQLRRGDLSRQAASDSRTSSSRRMAGRSSRRSGRPHGAGTGASSKVRRAPGCVTSSWARPDRASPRPSPGGPDHW